MRRRGFIKAIASSSVAWPLAVLGQQPAKLPTIGFFCQSTRSAASEWVAAFVQRLRELGWIENRTVAIDYRSGKDSQWREAVGSSGIANGQI
jgi:putative tryptophan/tyrosine transport system substrate-binding protein